jgi:predicted ATP-dependent endonuclease of OLD family
MRIRHVLIRNFKGIRSLEIDLANGSTPRRLTALIGDNGSGKTSALQAIALVLSMAGRRTPSPDKLNWHGFLAERISSLGRTRVEMTVEFDEEEVRTCKSLFEEWQQTLPAAEKQGKRLVPPSDAPVVTLVFENGRLTSPDGMKAVNQFAARYYIGRLAKVHPRYREDYAKVGSVFWFDQMRNLGQSLSSIKEDENQPVYAETWQSGVEQLRDFLVGWWAHHTSPEKRGKDYIPELGTKFNMIFRGVSFAGVAPRDAEAGGVSDFYFLLERGGKVFDIAEMSSGEQAVFPLIYEFVRLSIAKSVVLIDELELHLHPPQQQALLAALPKLGPDCQFIITTHSRFLEGAIPDEYEVRLEGGRLCL